MPFLFCSGAAGIHKLYSGQLNLLDCYNSSSTEHLRIGELTAMSIAGSSTLKLILMQRPPRNRYTEKLLQASPSMLLTP